MKAGRTATPQNAQAARLKMDADKWLAGKLAASIYGDRVTTEHVGPDNGPVQVAVTPMDAARKIAFALAKASADADQEADDASRDVPG